jgi:alpha-D-xyloside xylohydrolase
MLSSHSRAHGAPPKEPWAYSEQFLKDFRAAVQMKYRLMPYIYTQSYLSSKAGLPMMRAMFIEYPQDPACWMVDDQYLFGSDLLVATMLEETSERHVYLPKGRWIDYQTDEVYEGSGWVTITAGDIPIIVLVRSGAIIPQVEPAVSLDFVNWEEVEAVAYSADGVALFDLHRFFK